ncbi:MAG TPA: hypothetical protein VMG38_06200 [Trebonia sp.]|nr:hypothetical protein [Trebonia sp.]
MAIPGCITLLALVGGCTGSSSAVTGASVHGTRVPAVAAVSSASPCPATPTGKFARALYVTDAGLAAGAFRTWIYAPYLGGAFRPGAAGRAGSVARAAAAARFITGQLREVKASAQSDPALCRRTIGAIDKLTSTVRAMAARTRAGEVSPAAVTSAAAIFRRLQAESAASGAPVKAQVVASLPSSD